jgi:hypothetical protein
MAIMENVQSFQCHEKTARNLHLYYTSIFPIFFDDSIAIKGKNQRENKGTRRFLMKRKLVMLATAMMILVLAAPAWAEYVDFTQLPSSPGSQGQTLTYGGMVITAKTAINGPYYDPLPPQSDGSNANVYWGALGNLGVTGQSYTGLGVQRTTQSGTTGRPIDASEALVFVFNQPVYLQSISLTLEGLNTGTDIFSIRISTLSQGHGAVRFGPDPATDYPIASSTQTFKLGESPFWPGDPFSQTVVDVISVQSLGGAFGVANLSYAVVPEPLTLLLLGAGLIGIAGIRRFRK